jgi:ATP-dependent Clp protease, protease subunit
MKVIKLNKPVGYYEADGEWLARELSSANGEDIKLEISSPGGFVFDGIDMFNQLKNYSGKVHTHLTGLAASMASYIALAGEYITAESNAVYMIHNPSGILFDADYREAEKYTNYMKGLTALMAKTYATRTGKSEKEIRKLMDDESFFFGEEIKSSGFVDDIIQLEKKEVREDAIAYAQMSIEDCIINMKKLEKSKEDMNKVAAILKVETEAKTEEPSIIISSVQFPEIESSKNNYTIITTSNTTAQSPASAGDNKIGGVKIMNLDELKAQHPALYNEVFNMGKKAGKDEMTVNITAHAKWFEADPKAVMSAIEKGEEFTMAHLSAYTQSAMTVKAVADRLADNPEAIVKGDDKASEDKKEEMIQSAMNKMLGLEV